MHLSPLAEGIFRKENSDTDLKKKNPTELSVGLTHSCTLISYCLVHAVNAALFSFLA